MFLSDTKAKRYPKFGIRDYTMTEETTLLKIELRKSEYLHPNSDDEKKSDMLLYTIVVTSGEEMNVYLMEEVFWDKLEPKLRKFIKKMFDSTQTEIAKKELLNKK
jgi:hypothetical protein